MANSSNTTNTIIQKQLLQRVRDFVKRYNSVHVGGASLGKVSIASMINYGITKMLAEEESKLDEHVREATI